MGHPENIFIDADSVSSKLKCPICFLVLKEAVFHLHCQTGFCKACLAKVKVCPLCRKNIKEGVFNDITRREMIGELPVMCGETRECEWIGHLEDYETHRKTCKENMRFIICKGCNKEHRAKDSALHDLCKALCPKCHASFLVKDTAHHTSTCQGALLNCPNKNCPTMLPRSALEAHFSVCEHTLMWCPYYQFGCEKRLEASEIDLHEKVCPHRVRSNPLAERCKVLEDTIVMLKGRLVSSCDVLDMTLNGDFVVRRVGGDAEVGRLIWKIPHFVAKSCRFLESKSFLDSVGDEWTCRVYPNGDGNTQGSLTFGAYKTTDSIAKYTVEIQHPTNPSLSVFRSIAPTNTRWRIAGWGWRRLISRDRLIKYNYLDAKGSLTFVITVKAADYLHRDGF